MIIHAATLSLTIHPLVEHLPVRLPDSPEGRALRASIAETGVTEPLKISKGRIIDGREVWLHAKALGKDTVPCLEVPEGDVATIVLSSLLCRKHYSKSALAYLAFPFVDAVLKEAKKRKLANLKTGVVSPERQLSGLSGAASAEELAEQLGINRQFLFSARNIHGHFAKNEELKEHFEPQILSGELGLGAVLQGIAGWNATKDQSRTDREQLVLWSEKIKGFIDPRKFAGWDKADAETRTWVQEQLIKGLRDAWPEDLLTGVIEQLTEGVK